MFVQSVIVLSKSMTRCILFFRRRALAEDTVRQAGLDSGGGDVGGGGGGGSGTPVIMCSDAMTLQMTRTQH